MGLVYRACHLALRRDFAVKLIRPADRLQSEFLARFRLEAEALGRLKHPNIVEVTDFGVDPRDGGIPYLVLEYLEGVTLADRCRRGGIAVAEAISVLEPIARAVDFAHDHGILHRDLKPANVFLCRDRPPAEAVKILDFGIALAFGGEDALRQSIRTTLSSDTKVQVEGPAPGGLTAAGVVVGSIAYMAPERARAEAATTSSDIYSFGVLAYETLVGRLPFDGSPSDVLVSQVRDEPPLPSVLRDTIPPELDRPLLAALAKAPARRPNRAGEFVASLREAWGKADLLIWQAAVRSRRLALSGAGAVLLLGASAVLWKTPAIEALERKSVDARFATLPPREPDPRLLLVAIDDASLEADGTPLSQMADRFSSEVRRALDSGAAAVAIDLLLPETWSHSKPFSDLVLTRGSDLTLAALSTADGQVVGAECLTGLSAAALGSEQAAGLFGFVNLREDPDGVVRRSRCFYQDREARIRPTWASRAVWTLGEGPQGCPNTPADDGWFWIDYSVRKESLPQISWTDLPSRLDARRLDGRLLLVGAVFAGARDFHNSPQRPESKISGLALQALIADTMLGGMRFRSTPVFPILIGSSVLGGFLVLATLGLRQPLRGVAAALGVLIAYAAAALVAFRTAGSVIPFVGPSVTILVALACGLVLRRFIPPRPALSGRTP
jgi:CHASE2 domain-containing sensor protein